MPDSLPRRSGFTIGSEEPIWSGRPALRATLYLWLGSALLGWLLSFAWMMILKNPSTASLLSYVPTLGNMLIPRGQPIWLLRAVPWLFVFYPALSYTLRLMVTRYSITTQRINVRSGVFFRVHDQIELFRVRDYMIDAPIYYTIMGVSHVRIISRDESLPVLTLIAQPHGEELINTIRDYVQKRKDEIGMREFETNSF